MIVMHRPAQTIVGSDESLHEDVGKRDMKYVEGGGEVTISEQQCSFVPGKCTTDATLILKQG